MRGCIWSFILLRQIKWVPVTPEDLLVKNNLLPLSGYVTLRQLNLIRKKRPQRFLSILEVPHERIKMRIVTTFICHFFKYWPEDWDILWKRASSRKSCPDVLCKKGVLRNFAKFIEKHLCQGLFFNNVAGLRQ